MPLNNVRAIVFDVDGTLYPQRPLRARMLLELAVQVGCKPTSEFRTLKVLRAYRKAHELARTSRGAVVARTLQLKIACEISGEKLEFVERSASEWFHRRPLRHLKSVLYPGVVALLTEAKNRGIRLGVVSDYPAVEKLRAMGIVEHFDAVISSQDEAVGYMKPHPRGLQMCLRQLAVSADESVYIGDRADVDLLCAANAQTRFVLLGKPPARLRCLSVSTYQQLGEMLGFPSQV